MQVCVDTTKVQELIILVDRLFLQLRLFLSTCKYHMVPHMEKA